MALPLMPFGNPKKFVSWKFVCKTPAEIKRNTNIANQTLRAFLKGFNEGRASLGKKKKHDFVIKNKILTPKENGSDIFLFRPLVFRKSKGGPVDLASVKVQKPTQPNP